MRTLIYCELSRLWHQRWFWLVILVLPMFAYITGSHYLWINSLGENITSGMFLIVGLQENLFLSSNIVVAALAAALFTEEYRSGRLRLLFIRRYTRGQIFVSKLLALHITVLLLLLVLGICLAIVGFVRFPEEASGRWPIVIGYAAGYYTLAYATLAAIGSLFVCIAMYSKQVTFALGACMIYILATLLLDGLYLKFAALFSGLPYVRDVLAFMLVPYLQHTGLNKALSGETSVIWALPTIILLHIAVFTVIAYRRFVANDYVH